MLAGLIRDVDFALREDDGNLLIAFTRTSLREAHVVVRRIACVLRNAVFAGRRPQDKVAANVTLATAKAGEPRQPYAARDGQPGGCRQMRQGLGSL